MAVRSRRLFGPEAITTTGGLVYTVPADRVALVRALVLVNTHATDATRAYIGIGGNTAGFRIVEYLLAAHETKVFEGPFIAAEGEGFYAKKDATGSLVFSMHGSLLFGDAV